MKSKTEVTNEAVAIQEIKMTQMHFYIVGKSPLVIHAMSAKNKGHLLFPPQKKNAAEKATSMKHMPLEEFRDAAYQFTDHEADENKTRLYMPAECFHASMSNVAIDMIGAKKAQIARLTTVLDNKVPIFGTPQLIMQVMRSSDMNRTPDIRSLPILPEWCCTISVQFVASLIKEASIANLLAAAGTIMGVGDGRPQKGKKSFGQFKLVGEDDADFARITKQGRKQQDAALNEPRCFDLESESLMSWFNNELKSRAAQPAQSPRKKKKDEMTPIVDGGNGQEIRPVK